MEYISHALLFLFLLGIAYEIHALAFSCDTTFLNHPQFCPVTTEKKQTTQTITAVKKAREENQIYIFDILFQQVCI